MQRFHFFKLHTNAAISHTSGIDCQIWNQKSLRSKQRLENVVVAVVVFSTNCFISSIGSSTDSTRIIIIAASAGGVFVFIIVVVIVVVLCCKRCAVMFLYSSIYHTSGNLHRKICLSTGPWVKQNKDKCEIQ